MKKIKKVAILTEFGDIVVLNIALSTSFSLPINVERYIKPLVNGKFICKVEDNCCTWVGHSDWHAKFDLDKRWNGMFK